MEKYFISGWWSKFVAKQSPCSEGRRRRRPRRICAVFAGWCEVDEGDLGECGKSVNRILMAFRVHAGADEFFRQATNLSDGSWSVAGNG